MTGLSANGNQESGGGRLIGVLGEAPEYRHLDYLGAAVAWGVAAETAISTTTFAVIETAVTAGTNAVLMGLASEAMGGSFADGAQAGLLSGAMAGLTGYIGSAGFDGLFGATEVGLSEGVTVQRMVAQGLVRGGVSAAQGDGFGAGFASGAFSGAAGGLASGLGGNNLFARVVANATLAGTASRLAGGSFANGAATEAFSYLWSEAARNGLEPALEGLGRGAVDVAGKAWALPNTAIGTMVGLAGVPFGATVDFGNNSVQFLNYPWGRDAITLGNAQIYTDYGSGANKLLYDSTVPLNVGLHEQVHTYQYQVLGLLFLPAYAVSGGTSSSNPFERAANDYARGGGWWP